MDKPSVLRSGFCNLCFVAYYFELYSHHVFFSQPLFIILLSWDIDEKKLRLQGKQLSTKIIAFRIMFTQGLGFKKKIT